MDKQRIAELFIRIQQARERAWKAHIAKKDRVAIEYAIELSEAAQELERLLAS